MSRIWGGQGKDLVGALESAIEDLNRSRVATDSPRQRSYLQNNLAVALFNLGFIYYKTNQQTLARQALSQAAARVVDGKLGFEYINELLATGAEVEAAQVVLDQNDWRTKGEKTKAASCRRFLVC